MRFSLFAAPHISQTYNRSFCVPKSTAKQDFYIQRKKGKKKKKKVALSVPFQGPAAARWRRRPADEPRRRLGAA